MSKVVDAACFIINTVNEQEEGQVSNLSINKLLYFAQGLSLAKTGKPLFANKIDAWQRGPVIAKIYHQYKEYDDGAIPNQEYNINSLSDEDQDILLETIARYGKYSAEHLVALTHVVGGPWANNYNGKRNTQIPQEDIKSYFIENVKSKFYDESKVIKASIDKQGRLILPDEVEESWGEYDAQ